MLLLWNYNINYYNVCTDLWSRAMPFFSVQNFLKFESYVQQLCIIYYKVHKKYGIIDKLKVK